jgi:NAD(P)-dependent dehydrogenase (short-subunit alcohol dehydrogenase family)
VSGLHRLKDRAALVTGAGGGIGRGIALRFADEGARVGVADVDAESAEATATAIRESGGKAHAVTIDVADPESVERGVAETRAELGPIDVLVNVAGVWTGGNALEMEVSDWDRVMAVNARGVFLCSRAVLPEMVERKRGSIVNISSLAALKGTRRAGAYNASKAAVIALTKNMALDFADDGIRVNAICPGAIDGTGMDDAVRTFRNGYNEEYERWVVGLHPLGRLGTPEDVAHSAVFLASDEASWVTGSSLLVDGGCMTGY